MKFLQDFCCLIFSIGLIAAGAFLLIACSANGMGLMAIASPVAVPLMVLGFKVWI